MSRPCWSFCSLCLNICSNFCKTFCDELLLFKKLSKLGTICSKSLLNGFTMTKSSPIYYWSEINQIHNYSHFHALPYTFGIMNTNTPRISIRCFFYQAQWNNICTAITKIKTTYDIGQGKLSRRFALLLVELREINQVWADDPAVYIFRLLSSA